MGTKIKFTRINNDINGNPRYVCHYLNLLSEADKDSCKEINTATSYRLGLEYINKCYDLAVRKAKTIGGKRYHTKKYGGGIVFQSYNIQDTEKHILQLIK